VKRVLSIIISVAIGIWLAIALLVFFAQRHVVFPRHLLPPVSRMEQLAQDVQEVTVETADGERLYGLWKAPRVGRPVVVAFHGNASAPGWAADRF
jgi:hypothetical protein